MGKINILLRLMDNNINIKCITTLLLKWEYNTSINKDNDHYTYIIIVQHSSRMIMLIAENWNILWY